MGKGPQGPLGAGSELPPPFPLSTALSPPPLQNLLPSVCKVGDYIFGGFPFIF